MKGSETKSARKNAVQDGRRFSNSVYIRGSCGGVGNQTAYCAGGGAVCNLPIVIVGYLYVAY